ncbi:hypothetical protein [Peribacillus sp. NPDC058075]|uniref:hypothetical protein n=1 Tax=unclassified Peribacillus TaxID=2675266 RepID=UPI0036DC3965
MNACGVSPVPLLPQESRTSAPINLKSFRFKKTIFTKRAFLKHYSVKEVAILINKSEETVRRWLRKGDVFPNAHNNSDKEGWKIPAADIQLSKRSINEQPKTNNQTLTVSQVASRLGKSGETIKRWLRSGKHSLTLLRTAMYRDGVSLKMT